MARLEDLLQQCTVKLSLLNQGAWWGTGFFVAPGLILTCAHVVRAANGHSVQVQWQKVELEAVVEKSLPDPYDLALLRVNLLPNYNPPCVYLEYLDQEVRSRDPLYLFGYPDEGDREGEPRTFNCDGSTGSEIASILFNLGQVRPGMSGSPLLNQRTSKVCGIVKFTRDRSIDLGGGAIPTRVILEQFPELRELQREFHQSDLRWLQFLPSPQLPNFSEKSEDSFYGLVQWISRKVAFIEDLQPAHEDKIFNVLRRAEKQRIDFLGQEIEVLDLLLTYWRSINGRKSRLERLKHLTKEEDFLNYLNRMIQSGGSIRCSQNKLSTLIGNQNLACLLRALEEYAN